MNTSSIAAVRRLRLPHGAAFWTTALVFLSAMAFTTVQTPLYPLYQSKDGYPTWVTTIVFASYAAGVVIGLFFVGHLSDRVGRKPMAFVALGAELIAAILFLVDPGVSGLLIGRAVAGVGVGALTASATAHLADLRRRAGGGAGTSAAVATLANIGGLGLGPLLGGIAATVEPAPLSTTFVIALGVILLAAATLALAPETVERRSEPYHPQRIVVPDAGRGLFWAAGIAAFAAFAVFGLFTALAPALLRSRFGVDSEIVAGLVPWSVFTAGALSQVVLAGLKARTQVVVAAVLMVAGLAGIAIAGAGSLVALFIAGGVAAGAGVGLLFRSALGAAGSVASEGRRGETLAGVFLFGYVGLAIPAVLIGVALIAVPEVVVLIVFSLVVAVLVLIASVRMAGRLPA